MVIALSALLATLQDAPGCRAFTELIEAAR